MRAAFILFLILFSLSGNAQLRPKLHEAANRYFISLPYGKEFKKWIRELEQSKYVLKDSSFSLSARGLVYGTHLAPRKPFVETDTARLWVTKQLTQIRTLDSNGRVKYVPATVCVLTQEYKHLKKNTSEKEWRSILKVIMNDFRKNSYVTYLGIRNISAMQRMWIGNSAREEPMIEIQYGFNPAQLCYFIRLRMHFAVDEAQPG